MFNWLFPKAPKLVFLSARTFVPCDDPLRPVLDARYLDMRAAMASGSADAIGAILTANFTSNDASGKTGTAADMIASVLSLQIDRSTRSVETTITGITMDGDDAIVDQVYRMTPLTGAPPSMPRLIMARSIDRWSNDGTTWRIASTDTQEIESDNPMGEKSYKSKVRQRK